MKLTIRCLSVCGSLLLFGCSGTKVDAPHEVKLEVVPGTLTAAHDAYMKSDWIALGERVRDVLLMANAGDLARQNALELLDSAYEINHGSLPSTFKVPSGIEGMAYGQIAGVDPNGPMFHIFIRGEGPASSQIKNITVRKLPNEVLLDKVEKKGTFEVTNTSTGSEFELDATVQSLPSDGVFSVRLELTSGVVSEGSFIARGLSASASPVITSPAHASSLSEPNPMVRWAPFHSPERKPFERRSLGVYVSRQLPGDRDERAWEYFTMKPSEFDGIRIGDARGEGEAKLKPGGYWLSVTAGESRTFGQIRLVRRSRTVTAFRVVP